MTLTPDQIATLAEEAPGRAALWARIIRRTASQRIAEIGVYRGEFAEKILDRCPGITDYYMIDPWQHLDDWNKPANKNSAKFEEFFQQTMDRTAEHAKKRIVLRGRTSEVISEIPDASLDVAYIDGDHTLRGISIDLIKTWTKVRPGGWLGGDDFSRSIWQHDQTFEPTMVFPFAVYFAEAVDCRIYAMPFSQFLIHKDPGSGFTFTDLTGKYPSTDILPQLQQADR